MNTARLTLTKEERLSGLTIFNLLFKNGQSLFSYPIRLVWMRSPHYHPFIAQVAFAVSRKNFKKAVDRNRLKRLMREAYRNNKVLFYEAGKDKKISLLFIYVADELLPYPTIERAVCTLRNKLLRKTV